MPRFNNLGYKVMGMFEVIKTENAKLVSNIKLNKLDFPRKAFYRYYE